MKKKTFAVIGCGLFGSQLAITLASLGQDVIAVDSDQDIVDELADRVTYAVCAEVEENDILEEIGVSNADVAIIGMGTNLEASILAVMACKELGVPQIIAKAKSARLGNVLRRVGATQVTIPERDMGLKLAHQLARRDLMEIIELSDEHTIAELPIPKKWIGKTLGSLNVRTVFGLNIVAIRHTDGININPMPDDGFKEGDVIIALGSNDDLDAFKS